MKITILDGYCLNPGDLSWDAFRQFGEVEVFDRTRAEDVVTRAAGAAAVLLNKTPLPRLSLEQLIRGRDLFFATLVLSLHTSIGLSLR